MSNHLKNESSPYLLQHAENPVNWYPWGKEAFEKAEREDKPVFLSIGYSTCHWCHVMAHESFENAEIAEILNRYFVSIKVDREERPDIDSVYMSVCQTLTGRGGWPMSIFLTPQQKPFYTGTYFPPVSYNGMIGFGDLLLAIAEKWEKNKTQLLESADQILSYIIPESKRVYEKIDPHLPQEAALLFAKSFDREYGGFGPAPKFPAAHNLIFLMLYAVIHKDHKVFQQVEKTLEKMRRGGIFDHIGYGFSRYSTDKYFLVPHFEKMLYDNALLILAYAIGYKVSGKSMFLDTAEKTVEYVFREMTGPLGEFYSAQDADSEGEEGKYYTWSYEEIGKILGKESGEKFCKYFGITDQGNFQGKNIPNLLNEKDISETFNQEIKILYDYRKSRTSLHLDNKILTSWNSLMICALTVLYRVTGKKDYLQAAEKNQKFIQQYLIKDDLLYVSCRNKVQSVKGFLDDYAYYAAALLCLYESASQPVYLQEAKKIMEEVQRQFSNQDSGGFFLYGVENGSLITKPMETYDGAMPSGNSVMAYCLVRLWQITNEKKYRKRAQDQLTFLSGEAKDYPAGYSLFQTALLFYLYPPKKITVVCSKNESDEMWSHMPLYAEVKILSKTTEEYQLLNGKTTYYVCENHTCLPPSNEFTEETGVFGKMMTKGENKTRQ